MINDLSIIGLGPLRCLLFGSVISAVDPVAVLSVFSEIQVNKVLYIVIFGESLVNDAVSVVLYKVFGTFLALPVISLFDVVKGFISFFVISFGGLLLGLICAVLACLITRFTQVEPRLNPMSEKGMYW